MEVRVELLVLRINDLQAVLRERFCHLLVDHGNACAETVEVRTFGGKRTLEVVEERQHIREDALRDDGGKLFALLRRTTAEIIEVRAQSQHLCILFCQIGFKLFRTLHRIVCAIFCLLGTFTASFGSLLADISRRFFRSVLFFRSFRLVDLALHLFELFLVLLLQLILHE